MLDTSEGYDVLNGNVVKLYNPGVKDTDFILTFKFIDGVIPDGGINIGADA
jgi:hypothetical protein